MLMDFSARGNTESGGIHHNQLGMAKSAAPLLHEMKKPRDYRRPRFYFDSEA